MTNISPPFTTPSPRWIATGLIAGTVMYVLPSVLHGNPPVESADLTLRYVAERSSTWRPIHLLNIAAVLMWAVSLAALGSGTTGRAPHVARAANLVFTATAAVFAVYFSIHAMALPVAAERFSTGAVDPARLLDQVEAVLLILGSTAFTAQGLIGASIALYGAVVIVDDRFPRWLGAVGVVAGLGWLAGALAIDFAVIVPFTVLTWVWMVALGVVLWRAPEVAFTGRTQPQR